MPRGWNALYSWTRSYELRKRRAQDTFRVREHVNRVIVLCEFCSYTVMQLWICRVAYIFVVTNMYGFSAFSIAYYWYCVSIAVRIFMYAFNVRMYAYLM